MANVAFGMYRESGRWLLRVPDQFERHRQAFIVFGPGYLDPGWMLWAVIVVAVIQDLLLCRLVILLSCKPGVALHFSTATRIQA